MRAFYYRSDVLGSYSSTPSSESIKYIDEDCSMTADVVQTCAEVHPVPQEVIKSPKPILKGGHSRSVEATAIDRHQQTLKDRDKVVIVPALKLEKGSASTSKGIENAFNQTDFLEDDVFEEGTQRSVTLFVCLKSK